MAHPDARWLRVPTLVLAALPLRIESMRGQVMAWEEANAEGTTAYEQGRCAEASKLEAPVRAIQARHRYQNRLR